jgi:uncharacterized protein
VIGSDWQSAVAARGHAQPVAVSERIVALDVLRGIAILGVLASYTLWNLGSPPYETWSVADRIINTAGELLIDTKFLSIFAFLFGVGVSQQWRRFESRGADPVRLHARRMLFLLVVGLIHGALFRNGDILAPYALLGCALLLARKAAVRSLLVAAVFLAILPYALYAGLQLAGWTLPSRPGAEAGNLDWLLYWYMTNPFLSWPRILALMLCGVAAHRAGVVTRLATEQRFARSVFLAVLPLAVGTRVVLSAAPWPDDGLLFGMVRNQLYHLSAWSLAACYAAAVALLCQHAVMRRRLGGLGAVGRMAFSNYILQALLVVPLCLVFSLYDRVTPVLGLTIAAGVAAVGVAFSVLWLRRFTHGPLEWIWRRFTYGT